MSIAANASRSQSPSLRRNEGHNLIPGNAPGLYPSDVKELRISEPIQVSGAEAACFLRHKTKLALKGKRCRNHHVFYGESSGLAHFFDVGEVYSRFFFLFLVFVYNEELLENRMEKKTAFFYNGQSFLPYKPFCFLERMSFPGRSLRLS